MTHVVIALWIISPAMLALDMLDAAPVGLWGIFAACAAVALGERGRRREAAELERAAVDLIDRHANR